MTEPAAAVPTEAPPAVAPPPAPGPAAPPPKPSMLWALFAGLAVLSAVPLGIAALVVLAEDVRDAWVEGGTGMYAVAGTLAVGSFLCAVAVVIAARAWGPAALGVPFLVLLPALVGRAATSWDVARSIAAVTHASPADQATILFASLKEALWCTVFGGLASGALAIAAALAFGLAALARRHDAATGARNALAATAPVALLTGLTALAAAGLAHASAGPLNAVLHVDGADLPMSLAALVGELAPWERARLALAVLAAAAAIGGAVAVRRSGAAAVTMAIASLLTLGLLVGTTRMATSSAFNAMIAAGKHPPLLVANAPVARGSLGAYVSDQPPEDWAEKLRQFKALHEAAGDPDDSTSISLMPNVTAQALESTLQEVAKAGFTSVTLIVDGPPSAPSAPPLPPPFDAMVTSTRGVDIALGSTERLCGETCAGVSLEKDALVVDGDRWPLQESPDLGIHMDAAPLVLPLGSFEAKQVLGAAMAAMAHHRRLTFAIAGLPDVEPRAEGESPDERVEEPPPPAGVVAITKLTVQGPVNAKAVRDDLQGRLEELAQCTVQPEEPLKLPFTRKLQLAVLSTGEVSGVVAVSDVPDAHVGFEDCLEWRLKELSFDPYSPKGISVVTLELSVTEAKASPGPTKK